MSTPGPWEAAKIYINKSDGSSDTHIATAATYDVGETEACANARLIAAAPELLAALRDAVAALGGIRSDNVPESVRAAIAKAEGHERPTVTST